jgi:hypothetical protein
MFEYIELNSIEGKTLVHNTNVKFIRDSRVGAYIYFTDGTNIKVNESYEEIKAILSGKPLPKLPKI